MKCYVGLDLGQSQDYSAVVVAEKITPPLPPPTNAQLWGLVPRPRPSNTALEYRVRHIQRFPLGTSYPLIVAEVKRLAEKLVSLEDTTLAIDATGCGRPVFDMFSAARLPCMTYGVSITGGDTVNRDGMLYRVPKRDLVSTVQVLLQNDKLKIAEGMRETKTLVKELRNFKFKIDPATAHDSYSAWREGVHDDLVLATALAVWFGEHHREVDLW